MTKTLAFYYEFSSPYAYFASERIEALAERTGATLTWHPFLLGAAFKAAGTGPLTDYPLKGDYSRRDIERTSRMTGIPFTWPPVFPVFTVTAARLVYWTAGDDMAERARLSHALYRAAFVAGRDLGDRRTVLDVAEAAGLDRQAAEAAINDPAIKTRLREACEAAVAAGVFGAPFLFANGEPFWGHDRLEVAERWLETGGW